ncbi:MAG: tetratricopeptide repeat protein [Proteobacteria bacterium]|nr:tetratricopeptide repeat protein [Pseudomonadota bacterium]
MTIRSRMALHQKSVWLTLLVSIIASCGGAGVDATSDTPTGGTEPATDTDTESRTLAEPSRLRSMDGSDKETVKTSSLKDDSTCRIDATLPEDVPEDADSETLHSLGQQSILARDGDKAVAILSRAHKKDPQSAIILGDLATALLQCRNSKQAITYAEKAAALAPDNADIAANLAQVYQIVGRIGDAVDAYWRALEVAPDDPAIHNNLAVLLVLRDLESAEKEARKAVSLAPKQATYIINLGYVLYRKNRFADAEMILRRAIDIDPKNADAYNQLGLVLAAEKRETQAIESFRKALELRPDHKAAKENLDAMTKGFDFSGPWDKK